MKIIKRLLPAILLICMAFSMIGCSSGDVSYVVSVDGEKMAPGVYVGYLTNAVVAAANKVGTAEDFWNKKIGEIEVDKWIKDYALKEIKIDSGAAAIAKEMNIVITKEDETEIKSTLDYAWKTNQKLFEDSGCNYSSALKMYTNGYLSNKVFEAIYGDGAPKSPAQEEFIKAFNDSYANASVISLNYYDVDGNRISDSEIKIRNQHFEDMKKRVEAGEDYKNLLIEHGKWINETYKSDAFKENEFNYNDSFTLISKDDKTISNVLIDAIFNKSTVGKAAIVNQDPTIYFVYRSALPTDEDTIKKYKGTLLLTMKSDEFDASCLEKASGITIEVNESAVNYYSPRNVAYKFK